MTTHRILQADCELHIEVDGCGPALLLVNGAGLNLRQWDVAMHLLTPKYTVIRHDVRGTGNSTAGLLSGFTFEQYASDIVGIADELEIDEFSLWGMAWGARVALVTAANFSSRVRRLVVSDFSIDPADIDAQKIGASVARTARAEAGITETLLPAIMREHTDFKSMQIAMSATALHPDLLPFVESVRAPTLIATGDHDPNLASSRRALPRFKTARLVELQLTGHGSVLCRPDLVTQEVLAFLDEVGD